MSVEKMSWRLNHFFARARMIICVKWYQIFASTQGGRQSGNLELMLDDALPRVNFTIT